jgi:beta-lactamase class A
VQSKPLTRLPRRAKSALLALALLIAFGLAGLWIPSYFQPDRTQERGFPEGGREPQAVAETAKRPGPVLPTVGQVKDARVFAEGRLGVVSFAVTDTSGKLHCYRCRVRYTSASVVKAMLLVAYLDRLARESRPLTATHRAQLDAMISVSDNDAATEIYGHVGEAGLRRLARQASMGDFDVFDGWTTARITAADQARFFGSIDELVSAEHRAYALHALESVVRSQAWGIPQISRPGWRTLFKGGWRETKRGQLVHQVARLERPNAVVVIAILTDGNPRPAYGRATIRGIGRRLLATGAG